MHCVYRRKRFDSPLGFAKRSIRRGLVLTALLLVFFLPSSHAQVRKNVLMINVVGQSHPGPMIVTDLVLSALHSDPRFQVEFYSENLDAVYHPEEWREQLDAVVQQYRHRKLDLIVLLGPNAIQMMSEPNTIFPDVPVVFCCTAPGQIDQKRPDHRSTGSWFQLEPAKTVEAALGLLPETRHLFVVGGQSAYDRRLTALVKADLISYENKLDVSYLTDLPMSKLQERLRHLPDHSMVLCLSFFKDAQGREFLNIAEALPMITGAANAPVFGIVDTQLGHGIVGGFVVSFEEQGKIAGRDALEILAGKPPQDIPIVHGPSLYQFDWRELQRWKLDESKLPAGSTILFRQPTLWERHQRTFLTAVLIILSLGLTIYLLFERHQLQLARKAQEQLGGMLIDAQEQERGRLATEIHDDFSQRLAVLSLGLETTADMIPESAEEANRQIHELMNSASEIGADLHTLSHRLHSSTLERLGLAAGVAAFCREFTAQQGTQVAFSGVDVPRAVSPDVALCLFRIVQEGLRNVKKHSGAAHAQVSLQTMDGMLHLSILDDGRGFDAKSSDGQGLGLWSMQERVRLIGGRFEIHSDNSEGTRIEAWAPMKEKSNMGRDEPAREPVIKSTVAPGQTAD